MGLKNKIRNYNNALRRLSIPYRFVVEQRHGEHKRLFLVGDYAAKQQLRKGNYQQLDYVLEREMKQLVKAFHKGDEEHTFIVNHKLTQFEPMLGTRLLQRAKRIKELYPEWPIVLCLSNTYSMVL